MSMSSIGELTPGFYRFEVATLVYPTVANYLKAYGTDVMRPVRTVQAQGDRTTVLMQVDKPAVLLTRDMQLTGPWKDVIATPATSDDDFEILPDTTPSGGSGLVWMGLLGLAGFALLRGRR